MYNNEQKENMQVLTEKNWKAVQMALKECRALIDKLQQDAQLRDKIFAQQTQQIHDLQREVAILKAKQYDSGSTSK